MYFSCTQEQDNAEFFSNLPVLQLIQTIRSDHSLYPRYQHNSKLVKVINSFAHTDYKLPDGWEKRVDPKTSKVRRVVMFISCCCCCGSCCCCCCSCCRRSLCACVLVSLSPSTPSSTLHSLPLPPPTSSLCPLPPPTSFLHPSSFLSPSSLPLYTQVVFIDHTSQCTSYIDPRVPYPGNDLTPSSSDQNVGVAVSADSVITYIYYYVSNTSSVCVCVCTPVGGCIHMCICFPWH